MNQQSAVLRNKTKRVLVAIFNIIAVAVICFACSSFSACTNNNASKYIEVVSEPKLSGIIVGNNRTPVVTVRVKNISNKTVSVEMSCTVCAKDGSVTTGLTSSMVTLVSGETATLKAKTSYSYSISSYSTVCASFKDVKYKFY